MKIKFVDLAAQNLEIAERVAVELESVHSTTAYVGGHQVESFEREFAEFLNVKRVVAVANGTDALRIALLALGVGPGDKVVTVPMTFIATAASIVQTGARPKFVDIDPATGNMSIPALRSFLESLPRTERRAVRAIVPVHLYGLPAQIAELKDIAAEFNLKLVEDACQAHGARVRTADGMAMAGTIGDLGCFSFYPGKNLGAWGDGGAVATNDEEVARRVSLLSNHGRLSHYAHEICGYNSRLDSIQWLPLLIANCWRRWTFSRSSNPQTCNPAITSSSFGARAATPFETRCFKTASNVEFTIRSRCIFSPRWLTSVIEPVISRPAKRWRIQLCRFRCIRISTDRKSCEQ
jgi:dTDP-4-amino-4,6-dideoxygalactose transaminase